MIARVTVLLASMLLLGLVSAPVHAADQLALSRDGQHWSAQLPGSLFDPAVRWVPGDRRTESFFVRNTTSDRGELAISVHSTDPDRLLTRDDVVLEVRVGDRAWRTLDGARRSVKLDSSTLAGGEQTRVSVRASFRPDAGNRTQRDSLGLDFAVRLSDAGAGDGGDDDDGGQDDGGGLLPDTGARAAGWMLVVAGAAVGVGLALMRRNNGKEAADATN